MPDVVRIFISGYYGYSNPGDDAILSVIVTELRRALPGCQIRVLSGTPKQTEAAYPVDAVLWSDPGAIAKAVRESDLVLTGGGGILHDYGGFQEQGLLTEGNYGLGFHSTAGTLAALFGKPHMLYSVGVGPLFSEAGRRYTRELCETAQAIAVRDEGSRRLLEQIGVPAGRVQVTADPAFLFEPAPADRAAAILEKESVPAASFRVMVAVRHWAHEVELGRWEAELAHGLDQYLDETGAAQVVFLPFQQFPGEQEDDLAASRRVWEKMRHQDRAFVLAGIYTPSEKAALLAAGGLVVGMRLHALIFAMKARRPLVALDYDPKVREVVQRAGLEAFRIPIGELDAATLLARLRQAPAAPPVDVEWLAELARTTTRLALETLQTPVTALPWLQQTAVTSLLASDQQWRTWLREQKVNYEYQVRVQQEELDRLRSDVPQLEARLQQERLITDHERAATAREKQLRERAEAELEATARTLAATEAALAAMTARKEHFEQRSAELEQAKAVLEGRLAAGQQYHLQTVADWERYHEDLSRRLSLYRSQRAWRGMLALRKAYTLLQRQGWSGRVSFLPWCLRLLGGGGELESEQLTFPVRPNRPPHDF